MSRLLITSDLHLGHNNICKYRTNFSTPEEHHKTIFENLATEVRKRDTLYLLGDIAFNKEWLERVSNIKCAHKILICGNHDLERGIHMRHLVETYDAVYSMWSKRNYWFSHCPIHPQEIRNRKGNIHGHLHGNMVWKDWEKQVDTEGYDAIDPLYLNVCVEHTDWKPITFQELTQ